MRTKRQIEQDYDIVFNSSVCALQQAYNKYKRLLNDYMKYTFYDNNGCFSIVSGYEDRAGSIMQAEKEWKRLVHEVEHYRQKVSERG